jgi:hypothetical protein
MDEVRGPADAARKHDRCDLAWRAGLECDALAP